MISKEQALTKLGLSTEDGGDKQKVSEAYRKMTRRYPEQSFPDKYREICQAYEALSDSKRTYEEYILDNKIDLSWAAQDLVDETGASKPQPLSAREFRLTLARHILYGTPTEDLVACDEFSELEDMDDLLDLSPDDSDSIKMLALMELMRDFVGKKSKR